MFKINVHIISPVIAVTGREKKNKIPFQKRKEMVAKAVIIFLLKQT